MNLHDVEAMVESKIKAFNLHNKGWIFRWMTERARKRLGSCTHPPYKYKSLLEGSVIISCYGGLIKLSPWAMRKLEHHDVKDIILHEIAHALVGRKAGHGPKWKEKCRQIGAIPSKMFIGRGLRYDAPYVPVKDRGYEPYVYNGVLKCK